MGNTCFMASALCCLFACPGVHDFFCCGQQLPAPSKPLERSSKLARTYILLQELVRCWPRVVLCAAFSTSPTLALPIKSG